MKAWLVRVGLAFLRRLGNDSTEQVRGLVTELVRMRQELEQVKQGHSAAENMLRERSVRVDLGGMVGAKEREAMIGALREVPETKGLRAQLDAAWMQEMNTMTHPEMTERGRQWSAGRGEAFMEVKSWLEKREEKKE